MEFQFIEDNIQVSINEHIKPGDLVLVIGVNINRDLFEFIKCEVIYICCENSDIIIKSFDYLPFENKSFDVVINFGINLPEIIRISKKLLNFS